MKQKAVVAAGTLGAIGGLGALQGMTFAEFLVWAFSVGGSGAIIWGLIALLEHLKRGKLSSNFKFYFAQGLSLAVPAIIWGLMVWAGQLPFELNGLFSIAMIAYQLSQTFHWEDDQAKKQEQQHTIEVMKKELDAEKVSLRGHIDGPKG